MLAIADDDELIGLQDSFRDNDSNRSSSGRNSNEHANTSLKVSNNTIY